MDEYKNHMKPEDLKSFPESPTVQRSLQAYQDFQDGCRAINDFWKNVEPESQNKNIAVHVKNEHETLSLGFRKYFAGLISAEHLSNQFQLAWPRSLFEEYLSMFPDEPVVEYIDFYQHEMLDASVDRNLNYISKGHQINWLEAFANRLRLAKSGPELLKTLQWLVHFKLGELYLKISQVSKSIQEFEICKEIATGHYQSLETVFALGFASRNENPSRALRLLETFVEKAPKCHQKYPHALYTIGLAHFNHYRNNKLAVHFYEKGLAAENAMLPFYPKVQCDPKEVLKRFVESGIEDFQRDIYLINWKWVFSLLCIVIGCLTVIIKTR